jgi:hypothetical protein
MPFKIIFSFLSVCSFTTKEATALYKIFYFQDFLAMGNHSSAVFTRLVLNMPEVFTAGLEAVDT